MSHSPGHEELSSGHSCEFDACGAVVVDPSQEKANELMQLCFLQYMKDLRVIDTRICGSKICFCEIFTSEARNDLAKPVEVDVFEGGWVKAFSRRIPSLTTSH